MLHASAQDCLEALRGACLTSINRRNNALHAANCMRCSPGAVFTMRCSLNEGADTPAVRRQYAKTPIGSTTALKAEL